MQITFENRGEAGRQLAERFLDLLDQPNAIVLGLPRGGVPVAAEVASAIHAPLDVLLVRKVGTPGREELAMGAIASGDQIVLDDGIISQFSVTEAQIQETVKKETEELQRRERLYRGDRPYPELREKTVLLIDDGLATGSTMLVAIRAVKKQNPNQVIVGIPVGAPDSIAMIAQEVDRVECMSSPAAFQAVGQWYRDFRATSDEDVMEILRTT